MVPNYMLNKCATSQELLVTFLNLMMALLGATANSHSLLVWQALTRSQLNEMDSNTLNLLMVSSINLAALNLKFTISFMANTL